MKHLDEGVYALKVAADLHALEARFLRRLLRGLLFGVIVYVVWRR